MTMKIAFYKGTRPGLQGIYSRLVRWVEGGPYSHCELVFSDGVSASASSIDGGVRFKDIVYNPANWDFIDIPQTIGALPMEAVARQWFRWRVGKGYDLLGNIHFVLPWVRHTKSKWFCSEAVAAALCIPEPHRFGPNRLSLFFKAAYPPGGRGA